MDDYGHPKRAEAVEDVRAGDLLVFLGGPTHVTRFVPDVDARPHCIAAHDASAGEWVRLVYRGGFVLPGGDVVIGGG